MERRPTIRDVARASEVHVSTAARALKNDPRISSRTRAKVRSVAKEIGYVTDPMLAAFAAYRQKVRTSSFRGTIAWITNYAQADGWHNQASDLYYLGARERALELGYNLEHFWLRDTGMTARRASSILLARGIRGLLLCPQPRAHGHLSFTWNQFSAVTFGYSMVHPNIHRITTSHFRSIVTTMRELRALGYRRIGLACERRMDDRTGHLWSAAFNAELQALPQSQDIPPFTTVPFLENDFLKWFQTYRPQAIVAMDPPVIGWLNAHGYRVPQDVGVAITTLQKPDGPLSGVDERSKIVGTTAVDVLAGMLQRGEYGIPQDPLVVLVEGKWVVGATVSGAYTQIKIPPGRRKKLKRTTAATAS